MWIVWLMGSIGDSELSIAGIAFVSDLARMSGSPSIDIDYVARLARIELDAGERDLYARQLADVLSHFARIQQADVGGVEPLAHPFVEENVWDDDIPRPCLTPEQALANAPAARDQQVLAPKIVEDA
jgi:aspartyl-tRNA(Asn)/glutamyl-tRNA(Gln) amidotransferase subunit C